MNRIPGFILAVFLFCTCSKIELLNDLKELSGDGVIENNFQNVEVR